MKFSGISARLNVQKSPMCPSYGSMGMLGPHWTQSKRFF